MADRCAWKMRSAGAVQQQGQITSIYDKDAGLELAGGLCVTPYVQGRNDGL